MKLQEIYQAKDFVQTFSHKSQAQDPHQLAQVMEILENVRVNQDEALRDYTRRFDKHEVDEFKVPEAYLEESYHALTPELRESLEFMKERIIRYEKQIKHTDKDLGEFRYVYHPLQRVGFYVPGGRALYPSTVLMSILAAQVAGVPEIYVVTPTFSSNNITFAALYVCGVKNVFRVGGAQAVAALAYGTESIPKVDKIVGPGNSYVAMAKRLVFGEVGIDSIAGPSEILVYIDETADLEAVTYDIFAQAEHDPEATTYLLAEDEALLEQVRAKIYELYLSEERSEIIEQSLAAHHYSITGSREELLEVVNFLASEHVSIQHAEANEIIAAIRYAGAVFQGNFTPEAIGDYVAGPSHVLPTSRNARFSHGLNVNDFLTSHAVIHIEKEDYAELARPAIAVAKQEGLHAHAESLAVRLKKASL